MFRVKTPTDDLFFEDKEDIIEYYSEILKEDMEIFEDGIYYIDIEGERIRTIEEWENWGNKIDEVIK